MTDSNTVNNDEVICPNCSHSFRAIPLNVQSLLTLAGYAPPFRAGVIDIARSIGNSANKLRDECYREAYKAGWWNVDDPRLDSRVKIDIRTCSPQVLQWWIGTKLALVHSEVSEALEGLRKGKQDEHLPHLRSLDVELADAVIRIMDLAGGLGIDIGRAIAKKLAYNAQRADHKPENRDKTGGKAF